jgi:hypothetical protein
MIYVLLANAAQRYELFYKQQIKVMGKSRKVGK